MCGCPSWLVPVLFYRTANWKCVVIIVSYTIICHIFSSLLTFALNLFTCHANALLSNASPFHWVASYYATIYSKTQCPLVHWYCANIPYWLFLFLFFFFILFELFSSHSLALLAIPFFNLFRKYVILFDVELLFLSLSRVYYQLNYEDRILIFSLFDMCLYLRVCKHFKIETRSVSFRLTDTEPNRT